MHDLAPYAASQQVSRGRVYKEPVAVYRDEYQRDRDRIIHSAAFRRLEYKTQVFVNHEGDMFRTRLTHSIEVAQIGRTIARALRLNEDLTEAVALAHDLGHTPFGHSGQDALNECMSNFGGFEHNLQSLRVVDVLEERYPEFPGLNLTFETREGILKHCSLQDASKLGEVGRRFIDQQQPGLEAQLCNLADEIAYNNHDVDDGLRARLLNVEQLCEVPLFGEQYAEVVKCWPDLPKRRVIHEVIRRMINQQVTDLIEITRKGVEAFDAPNIDAVRAAGKPLVTFSGDMREMQLELKRFLRKHLYRHRHVHRMAVKAQAIIRTLFDAFMRDVDLLPAAVRISTRRLEREAGDEAGRA
ncbi:MAG: deoxyguanosinetriphosphate triphosphohydrolase, partial [Gammaproteobacteria bacterium]|nr:deoxyguanosinetriphosphate triphosphohydrolase [Gammaproteobacteria bacterium]